MAQAGLVIDIAVAQKYDDNVMAYRLVCDFSTVCDILNAFKTFISDRYLQLLPELSFLIYICNTSHFLYDSRVCIKHVNFDWCYKTKHEY